MSAVEPICLAPALEQRRALRARELSCLELVGLHLGAIERLNPRVNAVVTLVGERALERARWADSLLARGEPCGPLHGLPVVHKDLAETAGVRTTYGSPVFADHVPDHSALIVERLERAGAIALGKSNVPEWGAGSNCVNPVFGATRNPYDLRMTPGGSSGGAAAALACGMAALADGSDMGGSLRNPASFCNVVGVRTSPGRVPVWPSVLGWDTLAVQGPMARTVADAALMLSAIAGPDPRSPIALPQPGDAFAGALERDLTGVRVAWSRDLGGLPVAHEVSAVLEARREVLTGLGCVVVDGEPDMTGAEQAFTTWRAWGFEALLGELLDRHPDQVGPNVTWNIEQGRRLTGRDLAEAEIARTALYHRVRRFMAEHEFIAAPVTQVTPFPVQVDHPIVIAGVPMETYIDWMRSCWYVSAVGLPCLSVPAGFTPGGLPVGLQLIGRPGDDLGVLQLAHAFERETRCWEAHPEITQG